ncbi:hypothetical protein LCGC14_2256100 [marine sediment metagenome]|uniref:Uncharacterized protein n=1 Tax=marine sediment metagenome TaxID=412755 RepID=A0A0F9DNK0_9ZZZZ
MADPITVYDQRHEGHIITIFLDFTSGGATTAVELTITAGYPNFDLSKAHPIISGCIFELEGDIIVNSFAMLPAAEVGRSDATAPDTVGEYQITAANTFKYCNGAGDANGIIAICYWAAGNKNV